MRRNFNYFSAIPLLAVPILEMLGGDAYSAADVTPQNYSEIRQKAARARLYYNERNNPDGLLQKTLVELEAVTCPATVADGESVDTVYLETISSLVTFLMPVTEKAKMEEIWAILETNPCMKQLLAQNTTVFGVYMHFWRALSLRDSPRIIEATEALLPFAELSEPSGQILLLASMAANYQQENYQRVVLLLLEMPQISPVAAHAARLISAKAAEKL